MRDDKEIDAAAARLRKTLARRKRWKEGAREIVEAQIEALEERMTIAQADMRWYHNETAEDFKEGDNDVFEEVEYTIRWMHAQSGYKAP